MNRRRYATEELIVDVRGIGSEHGVRLDVEHRSGAALMVPRTKAETIDGGLKIETTGFDGTQFTVVVLESTARVTSSAPSAILGGATELELPAVEIPPPDPGALRVTGDEETMPIPMAKE